MSAARRLPPPPLPPLPFLLPSFTGARLANGLALRAARWGRRPTVAVSVLFPGAGSAADPPGREGTAEITGETFLGGTRRRDARALARSDRRPRGEPRGLRRQRLVGRAPLHPRKGSRRRASRFSPRS